LIVKTVEKKGAAMNNGEDLKNTIETSMQHAGDREWFMEGNLMAYHMTVTLTDQEYQMLATEAARRGEPPETLLRDLIRHLSSTAP
jgi:hypothetical protein